MRSRRRGHADEERAVALLRIADAGLHGEDDATLDALIAHARRLHNPSRDGSIAAVDARERELAALDTTPIPWEERESFAKATEGLGYVQQNRAWARRYQPARLAFEALFSAYRWHPAHRLSYLPFGAHDAATVHRMTLRCYASGIPDWRIQQLPIGGRARDLAHRLFMKGFPEPLTVFLITLGREAEQVNIPRKRAPGYLFAPWIDDAQHATLRETWKRECKERDAVSQKPYAFTFPQTHQGLTQRDVNRFAEKHGVTDVRQCVAEADELNRAARAKQKEAVARLVAGGMRDELQIASAAACDLNLVRKALRAAKQQGAPASRRIRGAPVRFSE